MPDFESMRYRIELYFILFLMTAVILAVVWVYFNGIDGVVQPIVKPLPDLSYDAYGGVTPTGSMEPCIDERTTILYKDNFTLKVGRIYSYNGSEDEGGILHRLIYIDGDQCLFKGDHNTYADRIVNCSQVHEEVVGLIYR